MTVQHARMALTEQEGGLRYDPQGPPQEIDPLTARLRLVRKVNFTFSQQRKEEYGYSGAAQPGVGDEVVTLLSGGEVRGDVKPDPDTTVVFGVPIVYTAPSRLKPGDLNFADPRLRRQITLEGDLKTLDDLLKRVAQATGLDLMADKRVRGLPLQIRAMPGQKALWKTGRTGQGPGRDSNARRKQMAWHCPRSDKFRPCRRPETTQRPPRWSCSTPLRSKWRHFRIGILRVQSGTITAVGRFL